jgi:hypothetical protein
MPQNYFVFASKLNFLIVLRSKKSYWKLLFSFELDSKISNFKKNRADSCPILPILGTNSPYDQSGEECQHPYTV